MKKLLFILLSICCIIASAASIKAKCIEVLDGDTIKVEDTDGGKFKVRLAEIDAPEKLQPYGKESKEFLAKLLEDQELLIEFTSIDMYGRIVGKIYTVACFLKSDLTVNAVMVREGLAWHYKEFSKDKNIAYFEEKARKAKIGLWKQPDPTAPWEYRKSMRKVYDEAKTWIRK